MDIGQPATAVLVEEAAAGRLALPGPAIAYVLFAFALPIVYNVMLSFEQTSPATIANFTAPFAGLANYRFILHDPTSREAIVHTLVFTVGSLAGQFLIGFALALLFSLRFPGRTLARSLVIVPWLLPLIVTGVIFRFLFQAEGGAVNQVLIDVGPDPPPDPVAERPASGLCGRSSSPTSGSGCRSSPSCSTARSRTCRRRSRRRRSSTARAPGRRLRLVIVPIILPVIEVTLLLGFVFTVKVFDLVIGLTGGGPANATQLITTWSYNLSFQVFSFGEGAALNNVLLVLALIAAPLYLWLSRDSLRRSSGGAK